MIRVKVTCRVCAYLCACVSLCLCVSLVLEVGKGTDTLLKELEMVGFAGVVKSM